MPGQRCRWRAGIPARFVLAGEGRTRMCCWIDCAARYRICGCACPASAPSRPGNLLAGYEDYYDFDPREQIALMDEPPLWV